MRSPHKGVYSHKNLRAPYARVRVTGEARAPATAGAAHALARVGAVAASAARAARVRRTCVPVAAAGVVSEGRAHQVQGADAGHPSAKAGQRGAILEDAVRACECAVRCPARAGVEDAAASVDCLAVAEGELLAGHVATADIQKGALVCTKRQHATALVHLILDEHVLHEHRRHCAAFSTELRAADRALFGGTADQRDLVALLSVVQLVDEVAGFLRVA